MIQNSYLETLLCRHSLAQVALDILRPKSSSPSNQVKKLVDVTPPLNHPMWQPQLSIINEERTGVDSALHNASLRSKDSLFYNETKTETPTSSVSTKWDPDMSYITRDNTTCKNITSDDSANIYDEIDESSMEKMKLQNSAASEGSYHAMHSNTMESENSWVNDTAESDLQSLWSEGTGNGSSISEDKEVNSTCPNPPCATIRGVPISNLIDLFLSFCL